jgi:hypothetical protein
VPHPFTSFLEYWRLEAATCRNAFLDHSPSTISPRAIKAKRTAKQL